MAEAGAQKSAWEGRSRNSAKPTGAAAEHEETQHELAVLQQEQKQQDSGRGGGCQRGGVYLQLQVIQGGEPPSFGPAAAGELLAQDGRPPILTSFA